MGQLNTNSRIFLRAPAKVNLTLRVHARLTTGYHLISSLVCPISLCDDVTITLRDDPERKLSVRFGPELESHLHAAGTDVSALGDIEKNIASRAAMLFLAETGNDARGFEIEIAKNIPLGAGLGGGSADAAAVLRGLNELCGAPLSDQALGALAARLGADVPVLLSGRLSFMTGFGEQTSPLDQVPPGLRGPHHLLLLKPLSSVDTGWAYEQLGFEKNLEPSKAPALVLRALQNDPHLQALGLHFAPGAGGDKWLTLLPQEGISDTLVSGSGKRDFTFFANDFQGLVSRQIPEIAEAERSLLECGAMHTLLSGSGSSLVGFFASESERAAAEKSLMEQGRGWLITPIHLLDGLQGGL